MSTEKNEYVLDEFIAIDEYVWKKLRKDKKLLSNRYRENTYSENIYNTAYKIDRKYHRILEVILNYPNLNIKNIAIKALELHKKQQNVKMSDTAQHNNYKKIRRMIVDLENIHLIEKIIGEERPIGNFDKITVPYRLTLHGIFFIILNYEFIGFYDTIKILLKNYPKNSIFQIFLYPYFEKKTLEELDVYLSRLILIYLIDILNMIISKISLWSMPSDNLLHGHVTRDLFSWPKNDDISYNEYFDSSQNWSYELRSYLGQEFKWNWIHSAKIIPRPESNLITINSDQIETPITIRINKQEKKAYIIVDGKNFDIFRVVDKNNYLSIEGKFRLFKKMINDDVEYGVKLHLIVLLFGIRNFDHSTFPKVKQTLSTDPKFKRTINEMIRILNLNR